jgi:hypothetical protein
VTASNLGTKLIRWAEAEPSIEAVALIGSRARGADDFAAADAHSDWDFQVVTSRPELFADASWLTALGLPPLAYAERLGRLGTTRKVSALFAEGELDWVVLTGTEVRRAMDLLKGGELASVPAVYQAVTDLSTVLQGGYRVLKGGREYIEFYDRVATSVPPARLSDVAVRQLAEGFACDYVSTLRKVERGELVAAQRWLHHHLVETNLRLLHELRQREGRVSYPDARRLETLADERATAVAVQGLLESASMRRAIEQSAATCRDLIRSLVGDSWSWPPLPAPKPAR